MTPSSLAPAVSVGSGRAILDCLTGRLVTALPEIWYVPPFKRAGRNASCSASSTGWNAIPMSGAYEVVTIYYFIVNVIRKPNRLITLLIIFPLLMATFPVKVPHNISICPPCIRGSLTFDISISPYKISPLFFFFIYYIMFYSIGTPKGNINRGALYTPRSGG